MPNEAYYDHLMARYLDGRCTPSELEELLNYLDDDSANKFLLKSVREKFSATSPMSTGITTIQSDRIRRELSAKIKSPVIQLRTKLYWVAASVILFITAASVYLTVKPGTQTSTVAKNIHKIKIGEDVAPGSQRALLTLADGSTLVLDTAHNGELARQGNTKLLKQNGSLAYNGPALSNPQLLFNTLSTPRGGQYHLTLPDGTQVWLNAASSIRFPTAFTKNERRVEVTGELYFEVAKDKTKPFTVSIGDAQVQVLGTHFNVMAYKEEASVNTTLLEGAVKFSSGSHENFLKPGQQSQLTKDGAIKLTDDIDLEEVMAWKNGSFHFEDADLQTVLRQLSRWYDVDVVYKTNNSKELLHADIPRNTNLSDALKVLELASGDKFSIEDKKIIVEK